MADKLTPEEAEQRDPEHASSERAGETPPQPDAERLESALREGGPVMGDPHEDDAKQAPLDPGGTSLT